MHIYFSFYFTVGTFLFRRVDPSFLGHNPQSIVVASFEISTTAECRNESMWNWNVANGEAME